MDSVRIEKIREHLDGFSDPVALLDKTLKCVYCNFKKLLPAGRSLLVYIQESFEVPVVKITDVMVILDGTVYNARLIPVEDEMLICLFFDADTLISLAERTDMYQKIKPVIGAIEYNTSKLWKLLHFLRSNHENLTSENILKLSSEFERNLFGLSTINKNLFEYINMLFSEKSNQKINIVSFTEAVVNRCNALLVKCGRCIDFIYDPVEMLIYANQRYALCALVNSIQNSLLFSPRDTVPILSLGRTEENGIEYVVLRVTNDSIFYRDKSFGDKIETSFDHLRVGYGIPIIEKFAAESGGRVIKRERDGAYTLIVMIPAAKPDSDSVLHFDNSEFFFYSTGIPDIIEIKMMEVIDFFGEV